MLLVLPSPQFEWNSAADKGVRLTIAVGKWCCGRNTHDVITEIVTEAFHRGDGTLKVLSRLYRCQIPRASELGTS